MEQAFTLKLRVRYAECDAQQVVFNARYADYADVAATEYVRAMFGSYENLLKLGMDNQVVNLQIAWKGSARFDDVLALKVTTSHVGNTSFAFKIDVFNHTTEQDIASVDLTYVMVDTERYQKCSIPEDIKKLLHQGGTGVVVDQSGVR